MTISHNFSESQKTCALHKYIVYAAQG